MKKRVHTDSALDEPDSCPQIELSERNKLLDKMGSKLSNSWKGGGGCFNKSTSTVFQYPYSEWIPNSIFHADYSIRMQTFEKWPKQMRPLPEELANCGFFTKVMEILWNVFSVEFVYTDGKLKTIPSLNTKSGHLSVNFQI